MDGQKTLWHFLLELLLSEEHSNIIKWIDDDGRFKLIDPEEVSRLWGVYKNRPRMSYDKLSRALRYYYDKNIIKKVNGVRYVYQFSDIPLSLSGPASDTQQKPLRHRLTDLARRYGRRRAIRIVADKMLHEPISGVELYNSLRNTAQNSASCSTPQTPASAVFSPNILPTTTAVLPATVPVGLPAISSPTNRVMSPTDFASVAALTSAANQRALQQLSYLNAVLSMQLYNTKLLASALQFSSSTAGSSPSPNLHDLLVHSPSVRQDETVSSVTHAVHSSAAPTSSSFGVCSSLNGSSDDQIEGSDVEVDILCDGNGDSVSDSASLDSGISTTPVEAVSFEENCINRESTRLDEKRVHSPMTTASLVKPKAQIKREKPKPAPLDLNANLLRPPPPPPVGVMSPSLLTAGSRFAPLFGGSPFQFSPWSAPPPFLGPSMPPFVHGSMQHPFNPFDRLSATPLSSDISSGVFSFDFSSKAD